ncbi:hypothetical protein DFJ73DRAFT_860988 [Zopfochytrium polystomum]|nr:hypothetical protein DFJ73DRAFT_860988 [Zopfochytrium polystomum]
MVSVGLRRAPIFSSSAARAGGMSPPWMATDFAVYWVMRISAEEAVGATGDTGDGGAAAAFLPAAGFLAAGVAVVLMDFAFAVVARLAGVAAGAAVVVAVAVGAAAVLVFQAMIELFVCERERESVCVCVCDLTTFHRRSLYAKRGRENFWGKVTEER